MNSSEKLNPAEESANESPSGDGTARAEVDLSGRIIGDFRVVRPLGQGGMGQVYVGEQISLKRRVALKFLKPELSANPEAVQRFQDEAKAVARLSHANIVQIYAVGEHEGMQFMALEFVEGTTLREMVEKRGLPEIRLGLQLIGQVAAALQRAGEMGVVHRDIKPDNILVMRRREVKVADFGLSRFFDGTGMQAGRTQSGLVMGTPLYMAPEQVELGPITIRTDIYSLGATAYYLFAGHPPFHDGSPVEIAYQHLHRRPEPLSNIRPDLLPEICDLVHQMLEKDPAHRPRTAGEVNQAIVRILESLGGSASGAMLAPLAEPVAAPSPDSATATIASVTPSTRWAWLPRIGFSAVLLGAAAGLAGGWWYATRPSSPFSLDHAAGGDDLELESLFSKKSREQELVRLVRANLRPETPLDALAGLKHAIELGNFYLKERRLDEADSLFKDLAKSDRAATGYRILGNLGLASVLAFRDQPDPSNKLFLEAIGELEMIEKLKLILQPGVSKSFKKEVKEAIKAKELREKVEAYTYVWKQNPAVRQMVARALHANLLNAPGSFPKALSAHLQPPAPHLRTATPQ